MNVLTFTERWLCLKWTAGGGHAGVLSEWVIPDDDILDDLEKGLPGLSSFLRMKTGEIVSDLFLNQPQQLILGFGGSRILALSLDVGMFLDHLFGIQAKQTVSRSDNPWRSLVFC
jgi:hypothetical protein